MLARLVSARFVLMLQHALTPNSVGSLVAWQQEAGVHAFTVEGKKKGGKKSRGGGLILTEAYGTSRGLPQ